MDSVRTTAVAGTFYPAEKDELERQMNLLLEVAKPEKQFESIAGIIAPHAGYIYSGKTAAAVYSLLKDKNYNCVVVISPSHYDFFDGCSIFPGEYYETPFGLISINKELSERIISQSTYISFNNKGHGSEHALEVHLPFLQKVLGDFNLIPIVMGNQTEEIINDLALSLSKTTHDSTLIVASSDLSHFYSKETANRLDSIVEKYIESFDYDGLIRDLSMRKCEACGGGPIAAMMKALKLRGKKNSVVIARSDSGDVSGDNNRVVGYLSAAIY